MLLRFTRIVWTSLKGNFSDRECVSLLKTLTYLGLEFWPMGSVTKFGEIVKIIVHFWRIYLVFGKTLIALWRNFFAKEANFHGQKWKIQFIWSHCHWVVIVQAISTLSVEVVVRERADGSPGSVQWLPASWDVFVEIVVVLPETGSGKWNGRCANYLVP